MMPTINLLPQKLVILQTRRRRLRQWTVACFVSLCVLAAPVGLDWYRHARAGELSVEYKALADERQRAEVELASLTTSSRETFLQLERARALRTKRSWSGMIALLAESMPDGCWLVELATDPAEPTGEQTRIAPASPDAKTHPQTIVIDAPRKLLITGYSTEFGSPMQFVSSLKATGVFSSVGLERTQREPVADGYYSRFEIECTW